jgi:hypothetical protein
MANIINLCKNAALITFTDDREPVEILYVVDDPQDNQGIMAHGTESGEEYLIPFEELDVDNCIFYHYVIMDPAEFV